MAGSAGIFLRDISVILESSLRATMVAVKKTTGVIADDLVVLPGQCVGIPPQREIPAVVRMAVGSLKAKAVIIPAVVVAGAVAPIVVQIALLGGAGLLAYETAEGIHEKFLHSKESALENAEHQDEMEEGHQLTEREFEDKRVSETIKTDAILSTEIIVIAAGTMIGAPILVQAASLVTTGLAITGGVYAIVGAIVKADDASAWLIQKGQETENKFLIKSGELLLKGMVGLTKTLPYVGLAAMGVVSGGIFEHFASTMPAFHHGWELITHGSPLGTTATGLLMEGALGATIGAALIPVVHNVVSPIVEKAKNGFSILKEKLGFSTSETELNLDSKISDVGVSQTVEFPSTVPGILRKNPDSVDNSVKPATYPDHGARPECIPGHVSSSVSLPSGATPQLESAKQVAELHGITVGAAATLEQTSVKQNQQEIVCETAEFGPK